MSPCAICGHQKGSHDAGVGRCLACPETGSTLHCGRYLPVRTVADDRRDDAQALGRWQFSAASTRTAIAAAIAERILRLAAEARAEQAERELAELRESYKAAGASYAMACDALNRVRAELDREWRLPEPGGPS